MGAGNTVAVVVTYNPELAILGELIEAVLPQVTGLIVVDNGSHLDPVAWSRVVANPAIHVVYLGENRGVATAQNIGIRRAKLLSATHVLILDQDSLPGHDMVGRLLAAMYNKEAEGIRVAAVGPRYCDDRSFSEAPFVRLSGWRVRRVCCARVDDIVEVDHLISSGSLIALSALDSVGGMREELFVDFVDTEWAMRAIRQGYRLFGVCNAAMKHRLGDAPLRVLGRTVPLHTPQRHYYLFRNGIWLCKQRSMPLGWRLATVRRLILMFVVLMLFGTDRLDRLAMMVRGTVDGIRNRMGRYA